MQNEVEIVGRGIDFAGWCQRDGQKQDGTGYMEGVSGALRDTELKVKASQLHVREA